MRTCLIKNQYLHVNEACERLVSSTLLLLLVFFPLTFSDNNLNEKEHTTRCLCDKK
jgi:hypothetical protein